MWNGPIASRTCCATREKAGLTVEKASADSAIPLQYVRLLEGETRVRVGVADELYLIPYFRRYATFLGLEDPDLVSDFLSQLRPLPSANPPTPMPVAYRSRLTALWKPAAIVAVVLIAASLIAQQSPERPSFDDEDGALTPPAAETNAASEPAVAPPARVAVAEPPSAEAPAAVARDVADSSAGDRQAGSDERQAPAAASADQDRTEPRGADDASPPASGAAAGRELRITADEETWLAIGTDDNASKSLLLEPGETRTWTARDGFTLTVGNAGGITLTLDGRELPKLGASGQVVRNLRIPREPPPSG